MIVAIDTHLEWAKQVQKSKGIQVLKKEKVNDLLFFLFETNKGPILLSVLKKGEIEGRLLSLLNQKLSAFFEKNLLSTKGFIQFYLVS